MLEDPVVGAGVEAAVTAAALAIGYPGDVVVESIDLTIRAGTSLALVGTNGSGKSTLLRTLVGLLRPVRGSLAVLGGPPGSAPTRVAYLAQTRSASFILPLQAIDVVRMARFAHLGLLGRMTSADHDRVQRAMAAMGVEHLARTPLRDLSGGQRQRVYLAQVLAHEADLILLDEPNAGLDAAGLERYQQAFGAELHRGAALVTATHDIAEAIEYDQVLLLARRVVALGPGEEVLTPDRLMETFGILIRDRHAEHRGRFTVAERGHGAPQVIQIEDRKG
ncbi:MAG: metal ABC transporter ATP-binding protein [Candidatus Limnocylindrales bacterium]